MADISGRKKIRPTCELTLDLGSHSNAQHQARREAERTLYAVACMHLFG
jgi:hypothetical protein